MSGAGFVRMPDCRYDDDLLDAYGLADARALLPDLLGPTEIVGGVTAEAAAATGLAAGTPVVARALRRGGERARLRRRRRAGRGLDHRRDLEHQPGDRRASRSSIRASSWSRRFGPDRVMAIESSATSAANLEWYVRELVERGGARRRSVRRLQPPRRRGRPRPPTIPSSTPSSTARGKAPSMRAGFYGIAGWHGEGHLLRALFEGVAFEHRRHVDVLRAAGVRFDSACALRRRRPQRGLAADVRRRPRHSDHGRGLHGDRRARRRHRRRRRRRRLSRPRRGRARDDRDAGAPSRPTRAWRRTTTTATGPTAC